MSAAAAGGAFLVALGLEVRTLLPGLAFWDTAEFQAIGPVLGVAHPTGYPSYTLLLWLASVVLQPFGDEALRANLLSALLVSAACGLTAIAVIQLTGRALLGFAAGVALGLAPTIWRIGLRADPHPLHLALSALLLVLLLGWAERRRDGHGAGDRWLLASAAVFGLALGNHALTALLVPGIGAFVLLTDPRLLFRRFGLVLACAGVAVGTAVLLYAYLPLRSAMNPPLDYANPETLDAVRYVVLGEQFRGTFSTLPPLAEAVGSVWSELWSNVGPLALMAVAGFVIGLARWTAATVLIGSWLILTSAFALVYQNADIQRYYAVPFMAAVILAALALSFAGDLLARALSPSVPRAGLSAGMAGFAGLVAAVVLVAPGVLALPATFAAVDSSRERDAEIWLDAAFEALEPDAVIVSWWSFSTPMWYGQYVEGRRPDVFVVDDRTVLDQGLSSAEAVIDQYLGRRPVYVIRLQDNLRELAALYRLERVRDVPIWGDVWRVVERLDTDA